VRYVHVPIALTLAFLLASGSAFPAAPVGHQDSVATEQVAVWRATLAAVMAPWSGQASSVILINRSAGYLVMSAPAFDAERRQAAVVAEQNHGSLGCPGHLYLFARGDTGGWTIKARWPTRVC
jgi:hypothetical protein